MSFNKKSILITGGTGSFGQFFAKYILDNYKPKKLIIFSRNENNQHKLKNDIFFSKHEEITRYFIGDIRDLERLKIAFKNVDFIVHAAALKHVDVAEYNPFEFIKTNIEGTKNVIEAAIYNKVKKVISLSTDKASSPVNLYGATKLCADKMIVSANNFYGTNKTLLSVVRYGNVVSSNGSVIPLFIDQLKNNKPITITDPNMTRFSIELNECVKFVDLCFKIMKGSEIFVPFMKSYKLSELVSVFGKKIKIKYIGRKSGEKMHEELISENESYNTICTDKSFIILPKKINKNDLTYYKTKLKSKINKNFVPPFSYKSNNTAKLKTYELKKIISKYETN